MRIREPGKIAENLWFLGKMESCVYLLEGSRESILINGGLSCLVPTILQQFEKFHIDESKITKILILHSHFDHVGIVPFFKRRHPEITVLASHRACQVLNKPKVLQSINEANHYVTENKGLASECAKYDLDWREEIDIYPVGEGDRVDLRDFQISIFDTPGHSPCSISAYVPELEILFPSEAGGLPCGDKIITYGTSSYSDFEKSIQKLKDLPVRLICSDHYGYVAGDEASIFIEKSIQEARNRRILIEKTYDQAANVDDAALELAKRFKDENFLNLVPDETFFEAHRQMTKHIISMDRINRGDINGKG